MEYSTRLHNRIKLRKYKQSKYLLNTYALQSQIEQHDNLFGFFISVTCTTAFLFILVSLLLANLYADWGGI